MPHLQRHEGTAAVPYAAPGAIQAKVPRMDSWLLCVSFIMACTRSARHHAPWPQGESASSCDEGWRSAHHRCRHTRTSAPAEPCQLADRDRRARTQPCVCDLGPALLREQDVACTARACQLPAHPERTADGPAAGAPDLMSRCRICCWCRYASPRAMSSATAWPLRALGLTRNALPAACRCQAAALPQQPASAPCAPSLASMGGTL